MSLNTERFIGSGLDELEACFSELLLHRGHVLVFGLLDLSNAVIQCGTCHHRVLDGSRELIEVAYLEWSNRGLNC